MLKTYLKKHSKLIIYLIGLLLISTLLYFTILKHPGYIFYWDLSGAFDFRDPFGQYFRLYTPWDGMTIGIKNRIPLVTLIYLIYLPFKLLGASNYAVIKIAVTLLFLGAYTTMYFIFPKLLKLLTKEKYIEKNINIWAMIMALLYSFIPFYAYRLSQLHLFYMSIFYPIHIYLFLKLLKAKKVDIKMIIFFVISMFFGLTSPNIIVFDLLSFALLFIIDLINKKFLWKKIKHTLLNLLVTFLGVILSSLFWLIPYFLMGSPQPGYVISEYMIDMLSQGTSLVNFLFGQADWFVTQGDLGALDSQSASINVIQIMGSSLLYIISIFTLFKYLKKKHAIFITILLILTSFLVLDFMPYHKEVFSFLIYSPIGWVFREINRISFFWYFWIYICFALGLYRIYENIITNEDSSKLLKSIFLPAIVVPFIIYLLPINVKIFGYLKPIKIDPSIEQVFELFENDQEYFSVYYYPRVDYYKIPWMKDKFEIAGSEEYKWLVYNSPKPPVYNSSVIPKEKTPQALYTEYIFEEREHIEDISNLLKNIGVKYVVLRKAAEPINLSKDYVRAEIIYPMYYNLEEDPNFTIALENDFYVVFENMSFNSVVNSSDNTLYSLSSFNISEHLPEEVLDIYNLRFCNIQENWDSCFDNTDGKQYLVYDNEQHPYLNLLNYDEKIENGYYPYEYTHNYGIDVDWGRASFYDAVNGELHNIFRKYDIHVWDFDVVDKVVYSDHSYVNFIENEQTTESDLTFTTTSKCNGNCTVFANVLFNHIGGEFNISVNSLKKELNTQSLFGRFSWVEIGELELLEGEDIDITIKSKDSFNAVGGVLILPNKRLEELQEEFNNLSVIKVPHNSVLDKDSTEYSGDRCQFETTRYQPLNITIVPNEFCEDKESVYLSNHNYKILLQDKDQTAIDIKNFEAGNEYSVVLTTLSDFFVLFGAMTTLILLIAILAIILF